MISGLVGGRRRQRVPGRSHRKGERTEHGSALRQVRFSTWLYGSPSTRHTMSSAKGLARLREPLVRSVHPARAKERRYQAGFLTSRIVALVAAFSRAEAFNGPGFSMASWRCAHRLQLREQCRVRRTNAAVPDFPIKPFRAPNTRRRDRQSQAAPQAVPLSRSPLHCSHAHYRGRAATGSPRGDQKGTRV